MSTVPGIVDLAVFNALGQPTVKIEIDRLRAARYGLAPGDINSTLQAAIGGQAAGDLFEEGSDRHFPMIVRLAPEYRQNLDALRRITSARPIRTATASFRYRWATSPGSAWYRAPRSSTAKTSSATFR